jgi:hypothetical protein
MYDTFIGFSQTPIRVMTITGLVVSILTVPITVYVLYSGLVGHPVAGWTSTMLPLTMFFGLQFLMMGIVGEYLYRIYAEVVRRPLYFVSSTTEDARRNRWDVSVGPGNRRSRGETDATLRT